MPRREGEPCTRKHNGWAYLGLGQALAAQKKVADAAAAAKGFERSWVKADVHLASSAF